MTEKEMSVEEFNAKVTNESQELLFAMCDGKVTDEQLDLMEWKMENVEQELQPINKQNTCIINLLKSVSEVRSDYQQLRQELVEVQALQRELSSRLRTQLRLVHGKFARLRQRLAEVSEQR